MSCPHKASCPLYSQFRVKALLNFWIASFCDDPGHERCARFQLSKSGRPVPITLLPNGEELVARTKP